MNTTLLKSIGAVLTGIIVIFALSIATDVILEKNGIMKLPFDANSTWFIIFVIIYRNIYVVSGSFTAAALAPANPMRHSMILACMGFILGLIGTIVMWHEPPHWYPIVLIILGWPSAWLGGKLKTK